MIATVRLQSKIVGLFCVPVCGFLGTKEKNYDACGEADKPFWVAQTTVGCPIRHTTPVDKYLLSHKAAQEYPLARHGLRPSR